MDVETLTVWLDTALLMLGGFILMTVLMLTVINDPSKMSNDENQMKSPGSLIIEATWANGLDADVDLWVQAPNERPVGYANKNSALLNLLRDDLGAAKDITDKNYEVVFSRGLPPGEYIVNLHMYRGISISYPVKVEVVVRVINEGTNNPTFSRVEFVYLKREGDQTTAIRFTIKADGSVDYLSINNVYKQLREAAQ